MGNWEIIHTAVFLLNNAVTRRERERESPVLLLFCHATLRSPMTRIEKQDENYQTNGFQNVRHCVTSKIMVRAKRRLHLGETSRDNPNNGSRCKDYICLIEKLRDNPNNSRESLRDISNNSSRCNEDYACLKEALRDNLSKGSRCRLHLPWRSIA